MHWTDLIIFRAVYKTLTRGPRSKDFGSGIHLNAGVGDKLLSMPFQFPFSYADYNSVSGAFALEDLQGRDSFLWRALRKVPCTSALRFSKLISR